VLGREWRGSGWGFVKDEVGINRGLTGEIKKRTL